MICQQLAANFHQIAQGVVGGINPTVDQITRTVIGPDKGVGFLRLPMADQMNTQNTVTGRKIICKHVPYLPLSHLSKKERHNRSFLIFTALVSQNSDLFLGDHGYQVNDPENEAEEEEAQDTNNEGNDVLGLDVAENTINCSDQTTQENLENDLNDLRQFVIHSGEGRIVRHCKCPPK
jgi:hypothetical protein